MDAFVLKAGRNPVKFRSILQNREKQAKVPGFCHKIIPLSGKFSLDSCIFLRYGQDETFV
jgi:hypothetical protein